MNSKPVIRIAMVDDGRDPLVIKLALGFISDRYNLVLTSGRDADYVFHSCRGYDVLKYSGIRIFVTAENVSPNFNISDYALAFNKIEFGDRYCWLPLIKLYREAYAHLLVPRKPAAKVLAGKEGFCAYVMSNMKNSAPERTQIVDLLDTYKLVALGGKWRNNVGGPVDDKLAFQSKYKFVIAFENSSTPGYLTEKFAEAAAADAVPIYWGDPTIAEIFNPNAFINCHDFQSLEEVLEEVKRIDNDDHLYQEMLSEPWFPNEKEPEALHDETFIRFLSHILDQPYEQAFRRNRSRWGIKHEKVLLRMYESPLDHGIRLLHKRIRNQMKKQT